MLKNLNKKVLWKIKLIFVSLFSEPVYIATDGTYSVFSSSEIKGSGLLVIDIVHSMFVLQKIRTTKVSNIIKHRENLSTKINFFKILTLKYY